MKSDCGAVLSRWRAERRMSQLDLALTANVSQKHLSFVELGRTQPSRDMILKLSAGLDLPLRARNELLVSAGFAPMYSERPLGLAEMRSARSALEMTLAHQEPFPGVVTDASWNIVMINRAAERLIARCVAGHSRSIAPEGPAGNLMELMFSSEGLQPCIVNWSATRAALLARLRREATAHPGSPSGKLLTKLEGVAVCSTEDGVQHDRGFEPVMTLEMRVAERHLKLFSMFTTFGLPQDITLQELRIDTSYPADEVTREFFLDAAARD